MGEGDDCKSKISIWWDIENCGVPRDVDPHYIAQNLSSALQQADLTGPIEINVFGDTMILQHNTQKALSDTGITLNHVPRGNKDAADKAILVAMLLWALDNPPPAHLLLVSGDGDFANALHRLRLKRYSIFLACPVNNVKPALLGAAKKVWHWKDLAKGQLKERESSQSVEIIDEYYFSKNGGSNGFSSSSDKFQQKLGSGFPKSSVMHTRPPSVSSGFASPQKMVLGLEGKSGGDAATTVSAVSASRHCTSLNFSQFENLSLQSEEKRYLTMDVNRDCNQSVKTSVPDTRSHSAPSSHEGRRGLPADGNCSYGVSNTRIIQSTMNTSSVKLQANYAANVSPSDPRTTESSHIVQNTICPVGPSASAQSTANNISRMGFGHPPHFMPLAANYNESRKNVPPGSAVSFRPPSLAIQDSYTPKGSVPRVPIKYAPPDIAEARSPLSKVTDPRAVVPQNFAVASSSLQSHSGKSLHDSSLDKVYCAMKTLEREMLTPTEANLSDCIRYWDQPHDNFDLKQFLSKAVELRQVVKTQLGRGLTMYFPPNNKGPWDCIDPGNMQFDYPEDIWNELRQFLLYGEQKQALLSSQNGYEAAQILKNASSSHIRELVTGKIIHVLQQAIQRKRWIKKIGTGWSPLTINEMVLLDYEAKESQGTDFRSLSLGHQAGSLKSFNSILPTNVSSTQSMRSKDAILEKLDSWLHRLLEENNEYELSKLCKDFEQATGIHLDYQKLGFPSLQDLLRELPDVACIETTRSGLLIVRPAKQDKARSMEPDSSRQSSCSDGIGEAATSGNENNAKLSRQVQVVKQLKSWLYHVMAIVQDGYDISKIHENFLKSTGIDLDKEGLDSNQLQGFLKQFPDIIQIVNTSKGLRLAYPASQKSATTQMDNNFASMGTTYP